MNKKIIAIFISISLIFIVTLIPSTTPKIKTDNILINHQKFEPQKTILSLNNKGNMREIYQIMVEKILKNRNPSEELFQLYSHPYTMDNIKFLSTSSTIETIKILFSERNIIIKLRTLEKYIQELNNQQQNENVQTFENILGRIIDSNLSYYSTDSFIPLNFQSKENKTLLNDGWSTYLHNNPTIDIIMNNLSINPLLFYFIFSIAIALWGFMIGGVSCWMPELIPIGAMVVEALILGLAGGFLVDFIFSSENLFINQFIESLCNLFRLTITQIEVISACLVCLIVIGSYLWLWNICPISQLSTLIQFIGGGSVVVMPPLLFSWFVSSYFPGDEEINYIH